jgi:hypothetical protein
MALSPQEQKERRREATRKCRANQKAKSNEALKSLKDGIKPSNSKNPFARFKQMGDIEIPEELFHPIETGIQAIDEGMSALGGIIPSQVTLLTGEAGAGKTTMEIRKIERLASTGKKVVFISLEMSDFQLKLQSRRFKGIDNPNVLITMDDDIEGVLSDCAQFRPDYIVLDSLQKAAMTPEIKAKFGPSINQAQIRLTEIFTKFAKDYFIPVTLIGHVGKDGKYIGPSCIKHEVDTHCHLTYNRAHDERHMLYEKNRFGGNMNEVSFTISDRGIEFDGTVKVDNTEVRDSVLAFKHNNKAIVGNGVDVEEFMECGQKIIGFLSTKYSKLLKRHDFNGTLKLRSNKKRKNSCCYGKKGTIELSSTQYFNLSANTTSGYKQETGIWNKHCLNKVKNMAVYILIHEFCHVMYQDHSSQFFKVVDQICRENKFLFPNVC